MTEAGRGPGPDGPDPDPAPGSAHADGGRAGGEGAGGTGRHAAGRTPAPPGGPGRKVSGRRPSVRRGVLGVLVDFVRPSGWRSFLLGVVVAVAGFGGLVRALTEGPSLGEVLGYPLAGVCGTLYACAAVLDHTRR